MSEKPFAQVASELSPEVYQKLKQALELGRWDNGVAITKEQQQITLQAILHYEAQHLPPEQRTGYMPSACKNKVVSSNQTTEDSAPIRWQD